jgi:hypothetical protein
MKLVHYALRGTFLFLALAVPVLVLLGHRVEPTPVAYDLWRFGAWVFSLLGMIGLFVEAGFTIRGRALGVLIDERNRYSLSRLQMALWTILVLATLYAVLMSNVVRDGGAQALAVDLDYNLVALMGFSIGSLVAAPMALSRLADRPTSTEEVRRAGAELQSMQKLDAAPAAAGSVLVKADPKDARLADLIRGEDVASATVVDLPRLQMLMITVLVILTYGSAIGHQLLTAGWLMKSLVVLSQTLTLLVLISHVGYIAGKLIPSSTSGTASQSADAARALRASQRAASLAAELQQRMSTSAPGDPRNEWLSNGLALARSLAAEAAQFPTARGASTSTLELDNLPRLEGRIDALETTWSREPPARPAQQLIDAPSAPTVSAVQRRLQQLGYGSVQVTGIPDVPTGQAIDAEFARQSIDRRSLHPRPFRFFEEVAQLL